MLMEDNNSVGIILPVYSLTPSESTLTVENVLLVIGNLVAVTIATVVRLISITQCFQGT